MKINAKVRGGLAWAGLVVIIAVPATDLLLGKSDDASANLAITGDAQQAPPAVTVPQAVPAEEPVPATDPIQTSSTESEAVQRLLAKGKKLPSYISDADQVAPPAQVVAPAAPVAVTPAVPAAPATTVNPPVTVANIAPAETPPVPLPRSARPHAPAFAAVPAGEQPLIIDENAAPRGPVEPFPLSDGPDDTVVTGDQLEEWDSGSLADYLRRKGLLSQNGQEPRNLDEYDPDGFYLDEGPNVRHVRRLGPADKFVLF